MPPITAPTTTPSRTTATHRNDGSKPAPRKLGIHSVWARPMTIAVKPSTDPIERSMFRDTMIRTIPEVMIATAADWTDRFQRLRGDRNSPPDAMLNTSHSTTTAPTMPSRRRSTSRLANSERADRLRGASLSGWSIGLAAVITTLDSGENRMQRPAVGTQGVAATGSGSGYPHTVTAPAGMSLQSWSLVRHMRPQRRVTL